MVERYPPIRKIIDVIFISICFINLFVGIPSVVAIIFPIWMISVVYHETVHYIKSDKGKWLTVSYITMMFFILSIILVIIGIFPYHIVFITAITHLIVDFIYCKKEK